MNIIWLHTVDSTNSEALRRLEELPSGTVLAAREQTAGRGQRGNRWFTEPGANLTFSIVLKFGAGELPVVHAHHLNYLASLAAVRFLKEMGVPSRVKWPNDIYVGQRKICGMLIENTLQGSSLAASVIGIGLNLNQTDFPQLANATSVALCTGGRYSTEASLERFLSLFEELLPLLNDAARMTDSYTALLFRKGELAQYHDLLTDLVYTGVIEGVDAQGRLLIREASGVCRRYRFKEVSYIL